jgi:hypothetical protein
MQEGATDEAYFGIVIPALMEDILRRRGSRNATVPQAPAVNLGKSGRGIAEVAAEICGEKDAFHILFIHADTGGRNLEADMERRSTSYRQAVFELCAFPLARCIIIAPRHETEAWMLADQEAVGNAMGFRGDLALLGLPANAVEAEMLIDPKQILQTAVSRVRGRRSKVHVTQIISAIAHRQALDQLRQSASFRAFEGALTAALVDLGCVS